jgi:TPR repeat protein
MEEAVKLHQIGFEFDQKGDIDNAIMCFRHCAEYGLLPSKFNLGCKLYEKGSNENNNDIKKEGIEWFIEAAKENHPGALNYLGVILERKNNIFALACYKQSAKRGNKDAINALQDVASGLDLLKDCADELTDAEKQHIFNEKTYDCPDRDYNNFFIVATNEKK